MLVESNVEPNTIGYLQGNVLVNVLVQYNVTTGLFTYNQITFQQDIGLASLIEVVDSVYKEQLLECSNRSTDAMRATMLGTAVDYDEAMMLDTERMCNLLRLELSEKLIDIEVFFNGS